MEGITTPTQLVVRVGRCGVCPWHSCTITVVVPHETAVSYL